MTNDVTDRVAEHYFGSVVPRADLAIFRHRVRGIGGVFQQSEQLAFQHCQ
jgi:hypothetical protein